MRRILTAAIFTGLMFARSLSPELANVNKIYVLQMSGGLDQYLANRMTRESRFVISADAKTADAIMTDHLGEAFEQKYNELYPPPEPPAPVKEAKDSKDTKDSKKTESTPGFKNSKDDTIRHSSFSRGKGNVFLVDRATRRVLWSYFLRPKNSTPDEMNRTADRIVDQLVKDASVKEKQQQ
jgi:hypothetical protein